MLATRHLTSAAAALAATVAIAPLHAQRYNPAPDQLEMADGRSLRGLILKSTADAVLFRTADGEITVPKSDIRRIREEADRDVYLTQVTGNGRLPSWNAIVHDFRDHDAVWQLQLIAPATITDGDFRNIPYLAFNVNKFGRLNVFGDPEDPVAIQFGIHGKRGRSGKYHQIVREFLAGHLNTRREIATLYSLSPRGDRRTTDRLAFLVTPSGSPETHGAWAITIYDPARLAAARVDDAAYARLTRPFSETSNADGTLRADADQRLDQWLVSAVMDLPAQIPKVRGFQRDANGVFRILQLE